MLIRELTREEVDDRVRVSAVFRFEQCELPERRIIIETCGRAASDLQASPDAFLLSGLPLACWMDEQRVEIDGVVCTALREHLGEAMRLWSHWYERVRPVAIEPTEGFRATQPRNPRRTAILMSGGVDSLANFRANRDAYSLEHPDAIHEALFLDGLTLHELDEDEHVRRLSRRRDARRIENLGRLAASSDYELTVLSTNSLGLYPDWPSYRDIGFGALMIAHAHLLGARFSDIQLSSTGLPLPLPPHGSHPAQDVLYSTAAVKARHPLPYMDRLTKLELIADWPEGLAALDVCFTIDQENGAPANCGRCSKCFRTMLGLVALGRLADAKTFPCDDLTPSQVKHAPPFKDENQVRYLEALLPHLEAAGRTDLAGPLQLRLHRWRTRDSPRRRLSRALRRRKAGGRGRVAVVTQD